MSKPRGNIELIHPDGTFMCHVGADKLRFYLKKDLVSKLDENKYQLKFEPNGHGVGKLDDNLLNAKMENVCVCCESAILSKLELHHIIPHCYRKFFPEEYKELVRRYSPYDTCLLCASCHRNYEIKASRLKDEFMARFGLVDTFKEIMAFREVKKIASVYIRHGKYIPEKSKELMRMIIKEKMGFVNLPSDDEINRINEIENMDKEIIFKHVVDKMLAGTIEDYGFHEFCIEWRRHFDTNANPIVLKRHGWYPEKRYEA
jgi:hypothetical protein